MKKEAILLGIFAILACTYVAYVAYGTLNYQRVIASTGTVKTIGVEAYWDEQCTDVVTSIGWGMIEPGTSKKSMIYVKNEGNSVITLFLNTGNWSPASAENYLSLSWDYTGETLQPNQVLLLTITLNVAQNVAGITSFTFDIIILGEG